MKTGFIKITENSLITAPVAMRVGSE